MTAFLRDYVCSRRSRRFLAVRRNPGNLVGLAVGRNLSFARRREYGADPCTAYLRWRSNRLLVEGTRTAGGFTRQFQRTVASAGGSFCFRWQGRRCEMGLGCLDAVPLAKARKFAAQCRDDLEAGRNPLKVRRAAREEQLALTDQRQASKTFGDVAEALIASKAPGRRNAKHRAQWVMTLSVYAAPLRALSVAQVTTDDILAVLEPIWILKSETASRTRGRIEAVLDAARVRGLAPALAANPARWRGHLELLLPEPPPPLSGSSRRPALAGAARLHGRPEAKERHGGAGAGMVHSDRFATGGKRWALVGETSILRLLCGRVPPSG